MLIRNIILTNKMATQYDTYFVDVGMLGSNCGLKAGMELVKPN